MSAWRNPSRFSGSSSLASSRIHTVRRARSSDNRPLFDVAAIALRTLAVSVPETPRTRSLYSPVVSMQFSASDFRNRPRLSSQIAGVPSSSSEKRSFARFSSFSGIGVALGHRPSPGVNATFTSIPLPVPGVGASTRCIGVTSSISGLANVTRSIAMALARLASSANGKSEKSSSFSHAAADGPSPSHAGHGPASVRYHPLIAS